MTNPEIVFSVAIGVAGVYTLIRLVLCDTTVREFRMLFFFWMVLWTVSGALIANDGDSSLDRALDRLEAMVDEHVPQ